MRYLRDHDLPEHPLSARGYPSIGCLPCTRPPTVLGDLRGGRWQGCLA
jgi:phosphoadenosine phosphosulfate reductase